VPPCSRAGNSVSVVFAGAPVMLGVDIFWELLVVTVGYDLPAEYLGGLLISLLFP